MAYNNNIAMNAILTRLQHSRIAFEDFDEHSRSNNELIIRSSSSQYNQTTLGRLVVNKIKQFDIINRPSLVSYEIYTAHRGISLLPDEVLVVCRWNK